MVSGLGFLEGAQTVRKMVRVRISLSFNMLCLYASSSQFVASPHIVVWTLHWLLFGTSESLEPSLSFTVLTESLKSLTATDTNVNKRRCYSLRVQNVVFIKDKTSFTSNQNIIASKNFSAATDGFVTRKYRRFR